MRIFGLIVINFRKQRQSVFLLFLLILLSSLEVPAKVDREDVNNLFQLWRETGKFPVDEPHNLNSTQEILEKLEEAKRSFLNSLPENIKDILQDYDVACFRSYDPDALGAWYTGGRGEKEILLQKAHTGQDIKVLTTNKVCALSTGCSAPFWDDDGETAQIVSSNRLKYGMNSFLEFNIEDSYLPHGFSSPDNDKSISVLVPTTIDWFLADLLLQEGVVRSTAESVFGQNKTVKRNIMCEIKVPLPTTSD